MLGKASVGIVAMLAMGSMKDCVGLDSATDNIKQAAKELADGLDKVDPVGLKKLLDENADLRAQLIAITAKSNQSLGTGVVTLAGRRLAVRIPNNVGDFRVSAWIDKPEQWSVSDLRVGFREAQLPLDDRSFFMSYCRNQYNNNEAVCGGQFAHWASNVWGVINQHSKDEVQRAFNQYLREAQVLPSPDRKLIDIGEANLTTGPHTVAFRITPLTESRGKWSFSGEIVVIDTTTNQEQVVRAFDRQSDQFPNHQLGTPLPDVVAQVTVYANAPQ